MHARVLRLKGYRYNSGSISHWNKFSNKIKLTDPGYVRPFIDYDWLSDAKLTLLPDSI